MSEFGVAIIDISEDLEILDIDMTIRYEIEIDIIRDEINENYLEKYRDKRFCIKFEVKTNKDTDWEGNIDYEDVINILDDFEIEDKITKYYIENDSNDYIL
jgi:hypothetical protein